MLLWNLKKEKRLRGIIFMGGNARQSADRLRQLNIPVVFATIGSDIADDLNKNAYSTVSVDDAKESPQAGGVPYRPWA
ncbi:hypothetical protein [Butyrivibrio sp. FCS014]|uniref:hypothetical protein n=1 Tax=Butyrivibrio sp. FCS014 TaxID=1408304 RepID=UPI002E8E0260|nr:hypothetical protein [Butyrivibrio sp. FCS014]